MTGNLKGTPKMSYNSEEFIREMIELYRSLPCLWKITCAEYSNRIKKREAYEKMICLFKRHNPSEKVDETVVRKKIQSLRTVYKKELNKVEKSRKSGAGTDEVNVPTLWYYDLLGFTRDQELPRKTVSSMRPNVHPDTEIENDPDTPVGDTSSSDPCSDTEQRKQQSQVPSVTRNVPQGDEDVYLDNEHLIQLVQERVPLWDSRDQLHKDSVVTRRLWNEVASALLDGWDSTPATSKKAFLNKVRTLWHSMKDRFNTDVRAEGQVRSGSAARTRTKHRYQRNLEFLRPVLATRATCSSTLQPVPGAVLHRTSSDPSQPSDSQEAPCRSATRTAGDQEAGQSGVPLSQVSATGFAGTTRQRQRALDRPVLPEFMHLSEAFHASLKSLSD
ncbi:uncharacterized protein [Dendrobates tinctorius]|uniref:uncharacterized protein n=1 Tax=Dendrobates tinctorius TaxID=92724 RepID=UPI003CC93F95